jgi:hypothetical protein
MVLGCASTMLRADEPGGLFLPAADGMQLWRQTLETVAADWPVARVVEPDFLSSPAQPGLIESVWVDPPGGMLQNWPPKRQRVVVRMVPAPRGAWIDAVVETQSLSGSAAGGTGIELVGGWHNDPVPQSITVDLAAHMAPGTEPIYALPSPSRQEFLPAPPAPAAPELPWSKSRFPRASRAGHKVLEDYRNFYSCESLVCLTAAFGAGALMANTGFDDTMQAAWQRGVEPTQLGTFFSGCKDIGEGRYLLPIAGAAAVTGLVFEGNPVGDVVGEWGSRSLRMFVVGAPPLYLGQWATGASRPAEYTGSRWRVRGSDSVPRRRRHGREPAAQGHALRLLHVRGLLTDDRQCPLPVAGVPRLVHRLGQFAGREHDGDALRRHGSPRGAAAHG